MTAMDVMGRVLKYAEDTPMAKQVADLFEKDCSPKFIEDKVSEYNRCGFILFFLTLDGFQQEQFIRNAFGSVGQVAADVTKVYSISEYSENDPIRDRIEHGGAND